MKILAFYLPQYHEIEENNVWWGKGYTEWNAVRNAKPLFRGHYQPKEPLNDNYYDLSKEDGTTWQWQADLARNYGIDGFCIYHYWFKDCKKLLETPAEILLKHREINIEYCFCWANEPWKRTWYSYNEEVLLPQEYGTEKEWIEHYNYLRQFFLDERYIKINNMPLIQIYRTAAIDKLKEMHKTWNELARRDGYDGIHIMAGKTSFNEDKRYQEIDSFYRFEPAYTTHYGMPKWARIQSYLRRLIVIQLNKILKNKHIQTIEDIRILYKYISLEFAENEKKVYPGICPMWDNTPRKQWKGRYLKNASPKLFEEELNKIKNRMEEDDMLFINAWNEWSEGTYLEPDKVNEYKYLEAIKKIFGHTIG